MALVVGGTSVTGTQTLDATKLTGNLPAISGASLTGISSAPSAISDGTQSVGAYATTSRTAPNPGIVFMWLPGDMDSGTNTIGSARNGGSASCYNPNDSGRYVRWVSISF